MSSPDWTKISSKNWRIRFLQINPSSLDSIIGELEDVDITSASIDESYYSDTRVQAQISFLGSAWTRQAWIRIIAELPDEDYSEELGTFFATSDDSSEENGTWSTSLNLESSLYALDLQAAKGPYTVAEGSMAKAAMIATFGWCNRAYVDNNAPDHQMGGNVVFETGSSILERVYDLADRCNMRLDVNGHGAITMEEYVHPSKRSSSFTIDLSSADGIALDGVSRSSNYLEIPSECIVSYTSGSGDDATEIRGYASNESTSRFLISNRGYILSKTVSLTEMSPETVEQANSIAATRLSRSSVESAEWTLTTEYMPVRIGAVGTLKGLNDPYYSGDQTVMIKNRNIDLKDMTMQLTLKLASSNDWDGDSDE